MGKAAALKTSLASLQWLLFIFANTVVVPISIGLAFELPADVIAGVLQSSLIVTGCACLLQGLVGHRFPLMEGQSGVMWGVMLNLTLTAAATGTSLAEIGGGIATGLLLAGAVVIILALFNGLGFLRRLFSPMVVSVYLFLLTFQLILIFFDGMISKTPAGLLDVPGTVYSLFIALLVGVIVVKGGRTVGNFAILIGMVVGWIGYVLLFPVEQSAPVASFHIPLFPLGAPNLNIGIIAITFIASIVNLSNVIAALEAAAQLLQEKATKERYKRSYILSGLFSLGSAVFGLVSYAPFASSIGFLESTRIYERRPFLIGGLLMALLGIIPVLGSLLATLPITVGYAVLFVAYLQLMGTSIKSLNGYIFNSYTIFRFAAPVLVGVSLLAIDVSIFKELPLYVQPLLSNGFVVGVLLSVVLEAAVKWEKFENG